MWEPDGPIEIDDGVRPLVRVGAIHAAPVAVGPSGAPLLAEMEKAAADLASTYAGQAPGTISGLAAARELYRAFGMDPTRTRPSSEALLRRVPLCALRYLLPIGLYDAAKVTPPVILRRGRPGESYAGIRKEDVHLEDRPVLSDPDGPFGNPTSDSLRNSVTESTRSLVMVIFALAPYPLARLEQHIAPLVRSIQGRQLDRRELVQSNSPRLARWRRRTVELSGAIWHREIE